MYLEDLVGRKKYTKLEQAPIHLKTSVIIYF